MVYTLIRGKTILMRGTINASLGRAGCNYAGCATMSPVYAIISGAVAGVLGQYFTSGDGKLPWMM